MEKAKGWSVIYFTARCSQSDKNRLCAKLGLTANLLKRAR